MNAKARLIPTAVLLAMVFAIPIVHGGVGSISGTTITVDTIGTITDSDSGSLSWSQTVNSGPNLILIAGVVLENDGAAPTISTFTYGAAALTKIGSQLSASGDIDVEIWQLPNPAVGTDTLTATFSGDASGGIFGGSASFFGVSGVRGYAGAQALAVLIPIGSSGAEEGDLLIDAVGANTASLTQDASQTLLAETVSPLDGLSAGTSGKGAGSGFQMLWTGGTTVNDPVMLVISLIPAAAIVPEYPWGLPLLAILMVIAYGIVKRRTAGN